MIGIFNVLRLGFHGKDMIGNGSDGNSEKLIYIMIPFMLSKEPFSLIINSHPDCYSFFIYV